MALIDSPQILATAYQLKQAKASNNRDQFEILKLQMKNDLGQYQLKEQQSKQKDLQSAYDTQQEAYADLQEQATIWNRTQNILRNPQEYSNPNDKYFALDAAGVTHQTITAIAEQARNKQLYERTIKKAPYTAGCIRGSAITSCA